MNNRIKELAIEAGLYVDFNGTPWPKNMIGEDIEGEYQKFAELIANDCANIIDNQGMFLRHSILSKKIRKDFGIEK